jgi:hypothetical protein
MRYTVIGVWDQQGDDDTVAGVVAGDVPLVDTEDTKGVHTIRHGCGTDSTNEAEQLSPRPRPVTLTIGAKTLSTG